MKQDLHTITEHRNVEMIVQDIKDKHIQGPSFREIVEAKTSDILCNLSFNQNHSLKKDEMPKVTKKWQKAGEKKWNKTQKIRK